MVLALDAAARRAGLRIGMPAAKAQALVPGLIMRDADPAADAKALDRLALWALQRYAPIAAADPPDGLVIDVTGAAHLHGGEDAMLKGMVARLAASGIAARAAIADSWGAAHAFARYCGAAHPRRPGGRQRESSSRPAHRRPSPAQNHGGGFVRPRLRAHRRTRGKTPRAACLALWSGTLPPPRSGHGTFKRAD